MSLHSAQRTAAALLLAGVFAPAALLAASAPHAAPAPHLEEQRGPARGASIPGYLGVDLRDVAPDEVTPLHLKDSKGAEITVVDHDGPAGHMGLRERDVVLQVNGILVEGKEQARRILHELAPGRSITLVVNRVGQLLTLSSLMADRDQLVRQAWADHLTPTPAPQAPASALPTGEVAAAPDASPADRTPTSKYSRSFLGTLIPGGSSTGGVTIEPMGPQLAEFFGVPPKTGLLVRSVAPNSPAAAAGVRAGDVVLRVNAQPVNSTGDWSKSIREAKGRSVAVTVLRDHKEQTLTLTAEGKHRASLDLDPDDYPLGALSLASLAEL